jgi:mono/diheme cytochrome c family protein
MRNTNFIEAIKHNMVRGLLVISTLTTTGCLATPAELASEDEFDDMDEKEDGVGSDGQVKLPIEVLGAQGTERTIEVMVDDPSNVTHLLLRCNACGYHDRDLDSNEAWVKATVSINGGAPINIKRYTGGGGDVGNKNIEILGPAKDYGGIGGLHRTVRMKIPITGIKRGKNIIRFKHNRAAAPSIGFRIITLNLMRNGSERVLDPSSFVDDNPAMWAPPISGAAAIQAGKVLWNKRNLLVDPGVDAINGKNGPDIVASCADCHASDGSDLAYFNFSNRSIVQRSMFHGLTQTQGEQIASYIRNLPTKFVAAARPWNPTYQPGPGMDQRPAYEWAAGAGVDAILDNDADMKEYLFPNDPSISLNDVRKVASRFGKLNLRELPVSLPMPEWNQWLPIIHPDDAFNTSANAIKRGKHQQALLYRPLRIGEKRADV